MLKSGPELLFEHDIMLPFVLQTLVMIGHDYLAQNFSNLNYGAIAL
jgi:hypothetical protein